MSAGQTDDPQDSRISQAVHNAYVSGRSCSVRLGREFIDANEWNPDAPRDPAEHLVTTENTEDMSGRGRGSGARGGMLKGATWEHDPDAKVDSAPSELFPKHPNLKKPRELSEKEKRVFRNYKSIQDGHKRGPIYTQPTKRDPNAPAKTFSETQFNSQYGGRGKADIDPFTSVQTYSQKYDPPKRTLPDIKHIKFEKSMFPRELWSTLEGEDGEEVRKHIGRAMEKKATIMDGVKKANVKEKSKEEKARAFSAKLDAATLGEEENEEGEEEEVEEEDKDDDYEDDEDGGDYNAEQYFDDGADDEDEGGDGEDNF